MDGGYERTEVTYGWRLKGDEGYGRTEVYEWTEVMQGQMFYGRTEVLRMNGGYRRTEATDGQRLRTDGGYGQTEVYGWTEVMQGHMFYGRMEVLRMDGGYRRMEVTDGRRFSFIILGLLKIKTEWIGMNLSVLGLKENILTEYLSSFSGKGASDLQFVYDFVADFNGGVFL